jgi:hypothetical protein
MVAASALLASAAHGQTFDGALVSRTSDQTVVRGSVISWQAASYEEGGDWWRPATQPTRLYVVPGDYFELAVNIHPGSLAPLTAMGTFGVTWAAIEKVE